jgi:hypothetical protein
MNARTRRIGTKTVALVAALLLAAGIVPALADDGDWDEDMIPKEQPLYPQDDTLDELQEAGGQGGGGGVGTLAVTGLEFLMIVVRLVY